MIVLDMDGYVKLRQDLLEQFETTLPVIKAGVDRLTIETAGDCHGEITFRNAGGGVLEGTVASNLTALSFSPRDFTGNRASVMYKLAVSDYKAGDVINAVVVVTSNGGELLLPFSARIIAKTLEAPDCPNLRSLEDFGTLTRDNINAAVRLFVKKEFAQWLGSLGCGHMELYEHFKFDADKERAVDNFLRLHGLKERAVLTLTEPEGSVTLTAGGREAVPGVIKVKRSGWGYTEAFVSADKAPWLTIITTKLTRASFSNEVEANIDYIINPELLRGPRAMAEILLRQAAGKDISYRLLVLTKPVLDARLARVSFDYNDRGTVLLDNNTGNDLVVEIVPSHDYIRLEGKRYLIGAKAEIPFEVRLTAPKLAQFPDRGAGFLEAELLVKTIYNKAVFTRTLRLGITDIKGYLL